MVIYVQRYDLPVGDMERPRACGHFVEKIATESQLLNVY